MRVAFRGQAISVVRVAHQQSVIAKQTDVMIPFLGFVSQSLAGGGGDKGRLLLVEKQKYVVKIGLIALHDWLTGGSSVWQCWMKPSEKAKFTVSFWIGRTGLQPFVRLKLGARSARRRCSTARASAAVAVARVRAEQLARI